MIGRLRFVLAPAVVALFAATIPTAADAQEAGARWRVLIPNFFPEAGADDDFGKDVAKELRKLMSQMATHQAIEEKEVKDKLKSFKIDEKDLDCIKTRQLGSQINAQIAMCASYEETGDKQYRLKNIEFWSLESQQKFDVASFAGTENNKGHVPAAQTIFQAFDEYNQQLRFRTYCFEYAQSQNWTDALRNCEQALEMNPTDSGVRYQVARIKWEESKVGDTQAKLEESLGELEKVLEENPVHEDALQLAGYVATQLGRNEAGRNYYGQYLELNPGAVAIRRRIAYEMHQAGDPEGAMLFIQQGLEVEENPDLYLDVGNYAFAAADKMSRELAVGTQASNDSGGVAPEVAEFYRRAISAYDRVFAVKPDSMPVTALRNVVSAHIQLGDPDRAAEAGKRFTAAHPESADLWSAYADALQRNGDIDGALVALDEVERIEPDRPALHIRKGNMLLGAGRVNEAIPILKAAVQRGQDPNQVARMIFGDAHTNGIRKNDFQYAERMIEAAKQFDVSAEQMRELNFWHGYAIFQPAIKAQEAQTAATARAALPRFKRALQLFESARGYGQTDVSQFIQNANTYIEIQEAILKRAGGQ